MRQKLLSFSRAVCISALCGWTACCTSEVLAQEVKVSPNYTADWSSLKQHEAAPEWIQDAKLGVYFHWGIYSVPAWGSEWYPRWMYVPDRVGWGSDIYAYHQKTYGKDFHYHDFIPMWKAPKFNAEQWVDMFEGMGAKFIGSIAEHHDGFSLWSSEVNPFNSTKMGPRVDVVRAIANETQKRNLKFMATFHHAFNMMFYPKPENTMVRPVSSRNIVQENCLTPQDSKYKMFYGNQSYEDACRLWLDKVNEVVDQFCPDYIWMDFGARYIAESYRKEFLQYYFNRADEKNKDVVVNTKGDFFPEELAIYNVERATMEDIMPNVWITDFILGSSWCYNRAKRTAIKPEMAIRMLADVVSKNGIMLLSAGPMADGTMPEEQVKAMEGIGNWLSRYGEAIYKTRPFDSYGQGPTVLKRDPKDAWNEYGVIRRGFNKLGAKDVRYTMRKTDNSTIVYVMQLGWSSQSYTHELTALGENSGHKVRRVEMLTSTEASKKVRKVRVRWSQKENALHIAQPKHKPALGEVATVYKVTLR